MQVDKPAAGEWYHTIDCAKCGSAVHAFHARSGPEERLPGPGLYSVRCAACGYPDLYKPAAFIPRKAGEPAPAAQAAPATPERRFKRRSGLDRRSTDVRRSLAATRAEAGEAWSH